MCTGIESVVAYVQEYDDAFKYRTTDALENS